MPKNPRGAMPLRDQIVARMAEEQQAQGMSDLGLAKRVSVFYPMAPTTVWKLKNADPPRGLSVDEATAISRAFGFETIEDFLHDTRTVRAVNLYLDSALAEIHDLEEALDAHSFGLQLMQCEFALRDDEESPSNTATTINVTDGTEIEKRLDDILLRVKNLNLEFGSMADRTSNHVGAIRMLLRQRCPELPPSRLGREGGGEE